MVISLTGFLITAKFQYKSVGVLMTPPQLNYSLETTYLSKLKAGIDLVQ